MEKLGADELDAVDMDLVCFAAIRFAGFVPVLARRRLVGVARRIVVPGVPACGNRVHDSLGHPIEGQDDGGALGGAPNHL